MTTTRIKLRGPAKRDAVQYIDLTPTWSGLMPALLAALQDGTAEGRRMAEAELQRLAASVDAANADARETSPAAAYPAPVVAAMSDAAALLQTYINGEHCHETAPQARATVRDLREALTGQPDVADAINPGEKVAAYREEAATAREGEELALAAIRRALGELQAANVAATVRGQKGLNILRNALHGEEAAEAPKPTPGELSHLKTATGALAGVLATYARSNLADTLHVQTAARRAVHFGRAAAFFHAAADAEARGGGNGSELRAEAESAWAEASDVMAEADRATVTAREEGEREGRAWAARLCSDKAARINSRLAENVDDVGRASGNRAAAACSSLAERIGGTRFSFAAGAAAEHAKRAERAEVGVRDVMARQRNRKAAALGLLQTTLASRPLAGESARINSALSVADVAETVAEAIRTLVE